ncbi:MAG: nitronate monooxygenase [Flavobacteriales bacterium]|nr:nitronate monooxygenase [Flavobacteriales bacterium]
MFTFTSNRICQLFNIQYPLIQAGMVWCSGWELAAAVSNAGGLGIIGAGSMYPEVLREHIEKCKKATTKPFAVNIPLLYPNIEEHMNTLVELEVPIVFTSAGNPAAWTNWLKERGKTVVHVVSSVKFAQKAEACGVDAVVAEGFEAGGHNGREETTTLVLVPAVARVLQIPLIAAGGIGCGKSMLAALSMGADAVQIGSRFVASHESSAHLNFKQKVVDAGEGATTLTLKEVTPVRLLKNKFYQEIAHLYENRATVEQLRDHLGRGRAKKGMFEGDMEDGELEIGQISANISTIRSAGEIVTEIIEELNEEFTLLQQKL